MRTLAILSILDPRNILLSGYEGPESFKHPKVEGRAGQLHSLARNCLKLLQMDSKEYFSSVHFHFCSEFIVYTIYIFITTLEINEPFLSHYQKPC
jgi:hypothetical protein